MGETTGKSPIVGKQEWRPNVEFFSSLSADGRYIICKTVITAIKPVRYFEKILEGKRLSKDHLDDNAPLSQNQDLEKPNDRSA